MILTVQNGRLENITLQQVNDIEPIENTFRDLGAGLTGSTGHNGVSTNLTRGAFAQGELNYSYVRWMTTELVAFFNANYQGLIIKRTLRSRYIYL